MPRNAGSGSGPGKKIEAANGAPRMATGSAGFNLDTLTGRPSMRTGESNALSSDLYLGPHSLCVLIYAIAAYY